MSVRLLSVPRSVVAIVALSLVLAAGSRAEVQLTDELPLERYADRGAVGLYVVDSQIAITPALEVLGRFRVQVRVESVDPLRAPLEIGPRGPPFVHLELPARTAKRGDRFRIAVVGDGFHGVLTSDSTRLRGLVTLDDVAEGRLESRADGDPVEAVERLDRRIDRNDAIRLPLTLLLAAATIGLAFARPRLAPRAILLALALNLWLSPALALAGALAAVAMPLGTACAAVLAIYLAALGLDHEAVALSPLGPSQVGRFHGINNLLETLLLVPAFLGAALLGRRGVLVAALALVTVAGNRFGADGGGLLVLLAGFGLLALRLAGHRLTVRSTLALAGAAVLGGAALVGLDAATGGTSHVTDALGGGPGELVSELGDRLSHSVDRTLESLGALAAVVAGLAGLVWAAARPRAPVLDALLVALAVSLVVNDTPSDVAGVGAVAAVTLVRLTGEPYARRATRTGFRHSSEGSHERRPRSSAGLPDRQSTRAGDPPR
jgi:hypothetical protein